DRTLAQDERVGNALVPRERLTCVLGADARLDGLDERIPGELALPPIENVEDGLGDLLVDDASARLSQVWLLRAAEFAEQEALRGARPHAAPALARDGRLA